MSLLKNQAVLLLGTNLGDRMAFLDAAKSRIIKNIGAIEKKSNIYESTSWGYKSGNKFLNQVVIIQCELTPLKLLEQTQRIEFQLGKTSNSEEAYTDRPIDIDILFFDNQLVNSNELKIPHPQLQNRRFTLLPLCEIFPSLIHPNFNQTISQILESCEDKIAPSLYAKRNED